MIQIPIGLSWTRNKGYPLPNYPEIECPKEYLVGVDKTVEEAITIIQNNLSRVHRVPPLALIRMSRGGKTTILKLYEYFEGNESDFLPIIISLNGDFKERTDENSIAALIRIIACQFVDIIPQKIGDNYVCNEQDLLDYIDGISTGRSVILFIDELNKLRLPLDPEVSNFLKKNFLDRLGRYLVFTSHVVLDIDPSKYDQPVNSIRANDYMYQSSSGSNRPIEIVHMPRSTDKDKLRAMSSQCSAVTSVEITLYGGLPSLLFIKKNRSETTPLQKLSSTLMKNNNFLLSIANESNKREILHKFLIEGKYLLLFIT